MAVTIKQIAVQEGVSTTTVFRALHNRERINPDTRRRILKRAGELTYRTNPIAKSLRLKKSFLVGVLMPDITSSFFPETLQGIEYILDEAGYSVLLRSVYDKDRLQENIEILMDRHIDGLIICHAHFSLNDYRQLRERCSSVIFLSFKIEGLAGPYVCVDHCLGAYLATRHLIERGHRQIYYGYIWLPFIMARNRLDGYKKALAESGLPFREDLVIPDSLDATMRKVLTEAEKPVAIFAGADTTAAKIISLAYDLGLNPFRDLAIVGFDDIALASIVRPTLTTIAQPRKEMGFIAGRALISLMQGQEVENVVLQPKLVVRESTQAGQLTTREV